jgi:peroxin-4
MKRLKREISALAKAAEEDPEIGLHPSEENIKEWTAYISGPPDSPYEGRIFEMRISVGADYPLAPPTIVFVTKVSYPDNKPSLLTANQCTNWIWR